MLKSRLMEEVRTRFAPSPTGFMHIGSLRTALFSYAFAKNKDGKFVLRIEDTDRNRYVPGATEKVYQILKIFGLAWDEGPLVDGPYAPYIQSERTKTGIYKQSAEKLVTNGHAYFCFCPPETKAEIEASHRKREIKLRDKCRKLTLKETQEKIKAGAKPAIRLRVPDRETVTAYDFLRKKDISWQTKDIDEVMLLKSDGFPTYHLGVVIDDALMKISAILRGQEWLPSTPIHCLLYQYLGFKMPQIGHFSLILDPTGGKLSKRKGAVACEEFLAEGYLPEAILNFIMLLGWAPKDNREIFSLSDFVEEFANGSLQTANSIFNRKKLDWFNGHYLRQKNSEELFKLLRPFAPEEFSDDLIKKTIPLVKDRIVKLADYAGLVEFLVVEPKVEVKLLLEKGEKDKNLIAKQIEKSLSELEQTKPWVAKALEEKLRNLADKEGYHVGHFFMALRIAITGKTATPPLFESMEILGKEKTISRLQSVIL